MSDNEAATPFYARTPVVVERPNRNPSAVALVVLGLVLIVAGVIVAVTMGGQASHDAVVGSFATSLGIGDSGQQVSVDNGWTWGGVIMAVVGALSCIAAILVVGVTRPQH